MNYSHYESNTKFDVIIVFGAAVWKNGQASPALKRRVLHAVSMMRKMNIDFLLLSGGLGKYPPTEAEVMERIALDEGVPLESIIIEEQSTSTFQSVLNSVSIMRRHRWSSALVVSDPYHLYRAKFVFKCFGIRAIGSSTQGGKEANKLWKWWYYHIREVIALPWYLLLVLTAKFYGKFVKKHGSSSVA